MTTVNLTESFAAFRNPGKGWRSYNFFPVYRSGLSQGAPGDLQLSPYASIVYTGRFAWAEVEPTQGNFDWSGIDAFVAYWKAQGLPVQIAIVGQAKVSAFGFKPLPTWLSDPDGGGLIPGGYWTSGTQDIWEPDYRDPIYLARVQALQNAFAARYQATQDWQDWIIAYDLRAFGTSGGEWWSGYEWHAQRCAVTPAIASGYSGTLPVIFTFDDFLVTDFSGNTLFADDFTRTVVDGWNGDEETSYIIDQTTITDFDVDGAQGTISIPTANTSHRATARTASRDASFTGRFKTDRLAVGGTLRCDIGLRRDNTTNTAYFARITLGTDQSVKVQLQKLVAGVGSNLDSGGANTTSGLTHAAGTFIRFRGEAQGASPTTVRAKVWLDGTAEPGSWTVTGTDSEATLQLNYGNERHDVLRTFVDAYISAFGSGAKPELVMNTVGSHNGAQLAINSQDVNGVIHAVVDGGAQMIRRTIGGTFVYPDPTDETVFVASHLDSKWFAGEWASSGGNISWVRGHSGIGWRYTWEAIDEALAWGASYLGWYKNSETITCGDIPTDLPPDEVPGAAVSCLRTWDGVIGTVPADHAATHYSETPLDKLVPNTAAHYIGTETLRDYFQRNSGYRFYVSQVTYPDTIYPGLTFPVVFTVYQRAVAKLLEPHGIRIRLAGASLPFDADYTAFDADTWAVGPSGPHTVTAHFTVPLIGSGEYPLQFAVVDDEGEPVINLANDGKVTDGLADETNDASWYLIDTITVTRGPGANLNNYGDVLQRIYA